jgi:hypothetical protein
VNVAVPEDGLEAERSFLVDILGLRHLQPGAEAPATANWFQADGFQIHVSRDADYHAPEVAHVALEIGDDIPEVERRLVACGMDYRALDEDTGRRLFCKDPAGNLWELRPAP